MPPPPGDAHPVHNRDARLCDEVYARLKPIWGAFEQHPVGTVEFVRRVDEDQRTTHTRSLRSFVNLRSAAVCQIVEGMPVPTLVIGVLTYRRADQLCACLPVILAQVSILNADGRGVSARVLRRARQRLLKLLDAAS